MDQLGRNRSVSPSNLYSPRWRSSPELQNYKDREKNFNLNSYLEFGEAGRCLEVVSVDPSKGTRIAASADCDIDAQGPGYLVFDVARNVSSGKWEIDRISIEDPQQYRLAKEQVTR